MTAKTKAPKLISFDKVGGPFGHGLIEVEYARGRRVRFYRCFKVWGDCEFGVTASAATERELNALAKAGA